MLGVFRSPLWPVGKPYWIIGRSGAVLEGAMPRWRAVVRTMAHRVPSLCRSGAGA